MTAPAPRSASDNTNETRRRASAVAPLLYWLMVVCGLAGITFLRLGTSTEIMPLWVGSIAGVALGQLVAYARVRAWLVGVVSMGGLWFAPIIYLVLHAWFGADADTCVLALVPAAICGYLALSESGGLVAFWYPAMLWMLVILDGPVPGAFDARGALPLVAGLAALFVAFLRARETRRVAIWQAHGSARLATPLLRTVLRASPLRAVSQVVWTSLVGAAALVLAAWIAPHLWQQDHARRANAEAAQRAAALAALDPSQAPCCEDVRRRDDRRARVREYLPLMSGHDQDDANLTTPACSVCNQGGEESAQATSDTLPKPGIVYGDTQESSLQTSPPTYGGFAAGVGGSGPAVAPPVAPPLQPLAPKPIPVAAAGVAPPAPAKVTPTHAPATTVAPAVVVVPVAGPRPPEPGAPWRAVLVFVVAGLGLHVLVRAVRRQLTLRHLARPLWAETLDQRISNHWERMLIGLRDAGIRPAAGEQPQALASRVGIPGMETCAQILERVRHGVRVDVADLEAMAAASSAVYRAARAQAGISGRYAAWLRWPLT